MKQNILEIKDLTINSMLPPYAMILDHINFSLGENEILAIIGQSGSGKTMTLNAIMGLLPNSTNIIDGEILYKKENILLFSEKKINDFRGKKIGIVFQNAQTCLSPTLKIGKQIEDVLRTHLVFSKKELRQKVYEILEKYNFKNPKSIYSKYPHELSGGQCQRILLAMVTACDPDILLADEPTASLDAKNREIFFDFLNQKKSEGTSIIIVTHDISIAKQYSDKICVFHKGRIVEAGITDHVINSPCHPYTKHLLSAIPKGNKISKGAINICFEEFYNRDYFIENGTGCYYSKVCKNYNEKCFKRPYCKANNNEHTVACWNSASGDKI